MAPEQINKVNKWWARLATIAAISMAVYNWGGKAVDGVVLVSKTKEVNKQFPETKKTVDIDHATMQAILFTIKSMEGQVNKMQAELSFLKSIVRASMNLPSDTIIKKPLIFNENLLR